MLDNNLVRQSKYVIIDASHGGSDYGLVSNGIKEKDLTLDISKYIYDRLKKAGINVSLVRDNDTTITDSDRTNKIINTYGNSSNVILISNHVDSDEDNAQVVYALRNNDSLSNLIANKLENAGITVKEPYQRRLESNTALDYYSIHRNTGDIQTVLVNYGNKDDYTNIASNYREYADALVDAIISYLGGVVSDSNNYYIVKGGDTLYGIARQFNTTVNDLKKLNNLSSNFITIGQKIIIDSDTSADVSDNLYVVKSGDTLYGIAGRFGVSVNDIKTLNKLSSNSLSIGQVLKIPNNDITDDYIVYTVKRGDSLYAIARSYGVDVSDIMMFNNLSSNLLSIGQVLRIPKSDDGRVYIVKSGDTLYSVARKYNTNIDLIKSKNNLNSNLLSVGQKLVI
ncbi:MAG: LysM peptidoglycan-binding domain-containing protein [Bacilli bacterium]|nr:LysM peptidoglycan-binding domain-containing protein [Bacilli bacterium]